MDDAHLQGLLRGTYGDPCNLVVRGFQATDWAIFKAGLQATFVTGKLSRLQIFQLCTTLGKQSVVHHSFERTRLAS